MVVPVGVGNKGTPCHSGCGVITNTYIVHVRIHVCQCPHTLLTVYVMYMSFPPDLYQHAFVVVPGEVGIKRKAQVHQQRWMVPAVVGDAAYC